MELLRVLSTEVGGECFVDRGGDGVIECLVDRGGWNGLSVLFMLTEVEIEWFESYVDRSGGGIVGLFC